VANRSIVVALKAEVSQYQSAMKSAGQVTKAAGDASRQAGAATAQGNQKMASSATTAAAAAQKLGSAAKGAGDSLRGTVGDIDKFGQSLTKADVAAGRYVDSAGYVREANDDFVAGFKGAARAVDEAGNKLKGTVGDVDKFGNKLSEADVAMGRYVNAGGRMVEANGKMAAGFGKAREAAEDAEGSADKAASGWDRLAKTAQDNEHAWSNVSTVLLGAGAAALAGVGMAVKTFADYDKAMSSVQAATHASEADMAALGEAAVAAGADTAFSAEEAARGIEELAKAGVSTGDILGGGLSGALSLAAAGGLEVGDAAEIAASALTQFKLEGSDVGHIADLLAAGAGKAQGSVHDLGMALNQVGLVASGTGLSIEETVGGLAAFASAGLVGSDAGTSFKTMLQRLTPQSEEAAKLMEELGLSAYDSQGEFIGLSEYAGKLQGALAGMSAEQRNATMNTLFGSDAVRAANVLYEQGSAGVQKWEDAVNDAGYAAETAALMQDNLAGDLEKLGGAMDTVFLKAGSGPNDFLRSVVQGAEAAVDAVGRVPAPVLSTGAAIAGIAGTGALMAGGLMKGVAAAAELKTSMDTLGISTDGAKGKLSAVGKAAGVAAVAFAGFQLAAWAGSQGQPAIDSLDVLAQKITDAGTNALDLDAAFAHMSDGAIGSGREIGNLDEAMNLKYGGGFKNAMLGLGDALPGVENEMSHVANQFAGFDDVLSGMVESGNAQAAADGFKQITDAAERQGIPLEKIKADFPQYAAALQTAAEAATGAAEGSEAVAGGLEEVAATAGEAAPPLADIVDALSTLGLLTVDSRSAMASYQETLAGMAETAATTGGALNAMGTDFDLTTESGRAMSEAMGAVAAETWDNAEGMTALGRSTSDVQAAMKGSYDALVNTATGLGMSDENARKLAASLLGIPPGVNVDTWMSEQAKAMAGETKAAVDAIPGEKPVSVNATDNGSVGTVQAAVNGLHGKTINALVTDNGTVPLTQRQINDIHGKTTQVTVTDNGTVYTVQGKVNGVSDGDATIFVNENGVATVQAGIQNVQGKTVYIDVIQRFSSIGEHVSQSKGMLRPGLMSGGRVPALATGGRLPTIGPGTDKRDGIMGISSLTGEPTAYVDAGEWVVNRRSSDKHHRLLSAINRDDPALQSLPRFATGGRISGRIDGLSARAGEENWQWQARQLEIIKSMEYTVGKLADWDLYEDGSGWVRTMDGAMVEIADGAYTVTYAAGDTSRSMGLAAQDARWAAETAVAAGGSFQGAGGAAVNASGSFQYAGVTANATAGTFQLAGQVTQQAAQAILAATAAVNAAGQQRKAAQGGGVTARPGETNAVWRGRQDQFEQAIARQYGGIKYSDIHEDGSGQIVMDDGRLIELNDGRWKFVSRFKYGPPAHGRTVSRYATGGRIPTTGPGTEVQDGFLGISSQGVPTAMVDAGEWVINGASSTKYNALLARVNRDDPSIRHLAHHATGGRAGSREYTLTPALAAPAAGRGDVDASQIAAIVATEVGHALSRVRPMVQLGHRQFYGAMVEAEREAKRR
jgi:TP901 family phage tail tape measure protein